MGCKKYKKHNYTRIDVDYGDSDITMGDLRKAGNKSISGLMHKCVAVKKRGCKK